MAFRLTWSNRNVAANTINIYRGDAPLDPANLPAPIGTVTNGDKFFVDATAEGGKTYYYILGTKTANDLVLTPNQKFLVADNRGAGTSVLKYGDDNLGYYGPLLSADFFNSAAILAAAKSTSGLPTTLMAPTWHKMARNGKIIYVPETSFGQTTWMQIYQAGLVFGIDANFPTGAPTAGVTATNQLVTLTLNGDTYRVRLLRGVSDGSFANIPNSDFVPQISADVYANAQNNEWNDLMYALFNVVPEKQRSMNFTETNIDTLLGTPSYEYSSSQNAEVTRNRTRIAVQERTDANNPVNRAVKNHIYSSGATSPHTKDNLSSQWCQAVNVSITWLPVIELVEPSAVVTV